MAQMASFTFSDTFLSLGHRSWPWSEVAWGLYQSHDRVTVTLLSEQPETPTITAITGVTTNSSC
ncbi:hypothetical protein J6590_023284 [Homalodisca vitripennis]|nr:hypothetical protein J6590_023284 [Homalodisca vitripennis]